MLPGFNHNIKYKDKIYHVQTEDSGEENPVVISHIFIGGNIIATKKTNYSHILGKDNMREILKSIMENQHKELIKELISGKYDTYHLSTESKASENIELTNKPPSQKEVQVEVNSHQNTKKEEVSHFRPISTSSDFTVFGEGTISEESLDKIILRYLKENK